MEPIHSSLDNVDNIDFVKDYPFKDQIPLPYWSPCNLVKVTIHGDDFLRLARYFLPATEDESPYAPDHVRYYGCNPPMGDRRYELPGNLMTVEACTTSILPPIPPLKLTSDGAPECSGCREKQQKRWVKLLSHIDDLWWASMIEPHYINGRFDEGEALIKGFFYAMLNRERIQNIMSILSTEEAYPVVPGSSICSGCTGLMG